MTLAHFPPPADRERAAKPPRAPQGLTAQGRALWREVVGDYALHAGELVHLESACRSLGELREIERVLSASAVMVKGSTGQLRPNPLLGEARQHRLAIIRLLAAAGLEDAEVDDALARSTAGRRLARQRWG